MGRKARIAPGIGERIASLYEGRDRSEFSKDLGVHDAAVGTYVRGDSEPPIEFLTKLHEEMSVDMNWLLAGEGTFNLPAFREELSIPHYDVQVNAGDGVVGLIPISGKYISFDESWFKQFVPINAVLGVLDVNGDSMMPTLRSGDSIIVNMNQEHIKAALAEGGIFVFSIRGDFKVKRLQPMANGDLRIISDNDKYQNETITAEMVADDIHIQAVVIKRIGDP